MKRAPARGMSRQGPNLTSVALAESHRTRLRSFAWRQIGASNPGPGKHEAEIVRTRVERKRNPCFLEAGGARVACPGVVLSERRSRRGSGSAWTRSLSVERVQDSLDDGGLGDEDENFHLLSAPRSNRSSLPDRGYRWHPESNCS